MLGTPPADHERIRELTGTVVRSLEPVADPAVDLGQGLFDGAGRVDAMRVAGRDLGLARQPGHRFFFSLLEVEPLESAPEAER